jgi:hypothetical protein
MKVSPLLSKDENAPFFLVFLDLGKQRSKIIIVVLSTKQHGRLDAHISLLVSGPDPTVDLVRTKQSLSRLDRRTSGQIPVDQHLSKFCLCQMLSYPSQTSSNDVPQSKYVDYQANVTGLDAPYVQRMGRKCAVVVRQPRRLS